MLLELAHPLVSLDAPIDREVSTLLGRVDEALEEALSENDETAFIDNDHSFCLQDHIMDPNAIDPEEHAIEAGLATQVDRAISTIKPKEERVLRKRFGIGEREDHTLEEIGKLYNLTRERIRQIQAKGLRRLRHPIKSQPLRTYYEN